VNEGVRDDVVIDAWGRGLALDHPRVVMEVVDHCLTETTVNVDGHGSQPKALGHLDEQLS
jgi:hypothetical protein